MVRFEHLCAHRLCQHVHAHQRRDERPLVHPWRLLRRPGKRLLLRGQALQSHALQESVLERDHLRSVKDGDDLLPLSLWHHEPAVRDGRPHVLPHASVPALPHSFLLLQQLPVRDGRHLLQPTSGRQRWSFCEGNREEGR